MSAKYTALIALALAALACARSGSANSQASSTDRRRLEHDGRPRSYLVHLPPQAADGTPLPVILNFHGGGGNAQGQMDYSRMNSLADEAGFIAVYPDGTGRFEGALLTWNAGDCCGYASEQQIDDVGFVRDVIADLESITAVDRSRVYATGLSNGAMMSYRLASEAPDLVAAIAPVAGVAPGQPPSTPVPLLHIHSLDDPRALYNGGLGPPFPLTTRRVNHVPVESVVDAWAANNGCEPEPVLVEERDADPPAGGPRQSARHFVYAGCTPQADVEIWQLSGAGHVWPGGTPGYLQSILGPSTAVIDANREAWAFFQRFSLPD
jgi:polyhydroxybutyrate depolymerase